MGVFVGSRVRLWVGIKIEIRGIYGGLKMGVELNRNTRETLEWVVLG